MTTPDPLEDVAFLARSPHRVRVLADGPRTRVALHEETGISQPTLGRILEPFQDRNWVERRGQEYALTPWGELLVDEFDGLLDTVETIQHLGNVIQLLPVEQMDFDVHRFGSATITIPQTGDILGHVRRAEERLGGADHVRIAANTIAPHSLEDRIEQHSEDVQLKQSTLDETYNRRTGVERTNESVKDCGLGRTHARGRVHAQAQVFLALCLCLVVAITNYERGDNPGSTVITV